MTIINRANLIKNNPMTEDDIKGAEGIFGKDVAYIKEQKKTVTLC